MMRISQRALVRAREAAYKTYRENAWSSLAARNLTDDVALAVRTAALGDDQHWDPSGRFSDAAHAAYLAHVGTATEREMADIIAGAVLTECLAAA